MQKTENPWLNLLFNIIIPAIILVKFSDPEQLGPIYGLMVGLSFPLLYGIYDLWQRKKYNFLSILGMASVLFAGGMGLLKIDGIWFAVKEAAIPGIVGVVLLFFVRFRFNKVKNFLYNDTIIDCQKVDTALDLKRSRAEFDHLLARCLHLFVIAFFISALLNFVLARIILVSPAGTTEFNQELGKMTALSYPVIVLPTMLITGYALWLMVSGIKKLTGLELEEIFKAKK